jgi:hypothetical protein
MSAAIAQPNASAPSSRLSPIGETTLTTTTGAGGDLNGVSAASTTTLTAHGAHQLALLQSHGSNSALSSTSSPSMYSGYGAAGGMNNMMMNNGYGMAAGGMNGYGGMAGMAGGMGGMYGQPGMMPPPSTGIVSTLSQSVDYLGRVSGLMQMNFEVTLIHYSVILPFCVIDNGII